jgi:hypothetical protein
MPNLAHQPACGHWCALFNRFRFSRLSHAPLPLELILRRFGGNAVSCIALVRNGVV